MADAAPIDSRDAAARAVLAAADARRQIAPFSQAGDLDLESAYAVAARVRAAREARGERVVGRKIGFTNRTIWAEYGVFAPIWGYVYDTTLHGSPGPDAAFDLAAVVEPRIEPEIVFALSRAPEPGMDADALLACLDWVAHGFEIVQSLYPGWRFTAADTVAAFGLHGALVLGPRVAIAPGERRRWRDALAGFEIALMRDGAVMDRGAGANVLGGGPLAAGEIVSTGTLTRALPVAAGETWSTALVGLPLPGARIRFT